MKTYAQKNSKKVTKKGFRFFAARTKTENPAVFLRANNENEGKIARMDDSQHSCRISSIAVLGLILAGALILRLLALAGRPIIPRDGVFYLEFCEQWFAEGDPFVNAMRRKPPLLSLYLTVALMHCGLTAENALIGLNLAAGTLLFDPCLFDCANPFSRCGRRACRRGACGGPSAAGRIFNFADARYFATFLCGMGFIRNALRSPQRKRFPMGSVPLRSFLRRCDAMPL